jgi:hypothetical protein
MSNKIAANTLNAKKSLENKKFLTKEPRNGNSHVLHTKYIYNTSITTLADPIIYS